MSRPVPVGFVDAWNSARNPSQAARWLGFGGMVGQCRQMAKQLRQHGVGLRRFPSGWKMVSDELKRKAGIA